MHEIIQIGDCSIFNSLKGEENKYGTNIIARRTLWKDIENTNDALKQSPAIGHTFIVFLSRPVMFHLHMKTWLFYDCPKAFYDGYEKEDEINQARFCFGEVTKIISLDEKGATIAFTVLKSLTLSDILDSMEIKELPPFLSDFFIRSINEDDYVFTTIGKYFQLSSSYAQGDMGQFCIFTEYKNSYTICLLSEWAFSEEWLIGGHYKLPEEIVQLILPPTL